MDINFEIEKFKGELIRNAINEDFINNVVKLNINYLDIYYLQTHGQASKSFHFCRIASFASFSIILIGIIFMFLSAYDTDLSKINGAKISSYVLTASGVLSEFIAAVFFYLYNQTIQKMGEYHQKLVLTQNISLAMKLSEELGDDETKADVQIQIIKELTKDINFYINNVSPGKTPHKA